MPATNGVAEQILEAHEARIQRVETGLSEIGAQVAEHGTKLDYLSQQVQESTKVLSDKMEECTSPLTIEVKEIGAKLSDHHERIQKLEGTEAKRSERSQAIRRVVWAVSIALVGAGGKTLFDLLIRLFS